MPNMSWRLFVRSRSCAGTKLLNLKVNFNFGAPLTLFECPQYKF